MASKTGRNAKNSGPENSRQARIAEMRRAEQARDRRNKILAITASAVVIIALAGFGTYVINDQNEKERKRDEAIKAPVTGEQVWDAKKLSRNHVDTPVKYEMTPPVGGDHHQRWMNCDGDVYTSPVPEVNAVHSLEHGAVWVTYNDKAPKAEVDKLAEKVKKTPYTLMSPVKEQASAIMLSAWGKQVTVDNAGDPRVDQFFGKYVQGPQTPEPGAACTQGLAAQ
ncbi:hypothetical protein DEJ50_23875 [Streptomyces venezuelae]|uniref:DUF3105 domain-containing protein n=1 Tax=Streptomyces venezuelae TaxID=54571 RepID=A0A5P2D5T9_STRVZ|nr:DUF3105 domain-containing protein [Streptomyces venezuelae]QES50406.1 hypothetical protein DEJ50_23875 [Streptomyces venezuelae]